MAILEVPFSFSAVVAYLMGTVTSKCEFYGNHYIHNIADHRSFDERSHFRELYVELSRTDCTPSLMISPTGLEVKERKN